MKPDLWGPEAAERLMTDLTSVPRPSTRQSPLEQEVFNLRRIGLDQPEPDAPLGDLDRGWFADVSLVVVDAVVARDKRALDALDDLIREVHRVVVGARRDPSEPHDPPDRADQLRSCESWAQLTANYVRSALDRVAPAAAAVRMRGTYREQILRIVADQPGINSRTIRSLINANTPAPQPAGRAPKLMDEGQLSRLGNSLRAEGYVFAERGARGLSWELTPRGEELLDHLSRGSEGAGPHGNGMVITTGSVAPVAVAQMLREDLPPVVSFVRSNDVIKYRRAQRTNTRGQEAGDEQGSVQPVSIDAVIKGLLDDHLGEVPTGFTVGERVYTRTAHSSTIPG